MTTTVLTVDDSRSMRDMLKHSLSEAGYRVVQAEDGVHGLEVLENETPDVIVTDINMPRLDGIETLRQLKADPNTAKIPVIMLTTTDEPREIERCYALGCNVYITKPVEYERFCEALRELGMFLQFVRVPLEAE